MKVILVNNEIVSLENVKFVSRDPTGDRVAIYYLNGEMFHPLCFKGQNKKEISQEVFEKIFKILREEN